MGLALVISGCFHLKSKKDSGLNLLCLLEDLYKSRKEQACVVERWLVSCRRLFTVSAEGPCLKEFPGRFMQPFPFIVFPSKVSK